jgi:hypothetical protein
LNTRFSAPLDPTALLGFAEQVRLDARVQTLMAEVEELLGDSWLAIQKADQRWQFSRSFRSRHRLAVLADVFRAFGQGKRHPSRVSPLAALGELIATRDLLAAWKGDPLWPSLVRGLKNPAEYAHSLVLLGFADTVRKNGGVVELNPAAGKGRSPDLIVGTADTSLINVEVKIAHDLLWPLEPLTAAEARRRVRKLFHSAGTGSTGQLAPPQTGILVIGGLSFEPRTLDLLRSAVERYFLHPPGDYSHILGAAFTWIGSAVSESDVQIARDEFAIYSKLMVMVKNDFVRNGGYSGHDNILLKD